jgi:hypothetical protein
MRVITLSAAGVLLALPAHGHHSDAALDMETILTLDGTVTEYSMRNPHSYVSFETTGENGEAVEWLVQMGSALTSSRRGWARDSLSVGDPVTVSLRPARDGRPYGLMSELRKDGSVIGTRAGGAAAVQPQDTPRATSLAGRWLVDRDSRGPNYPGGLDQLMIRELTLTEAGKVAEAAYQQSSDENPELNCITKPTPASIVYTDLYPMEFEFNEAAETLTIRSQYFDQVRTVYLDEREHPDPSILMHEGHSVGRTEGDTLVIDTTNFAYHRSPYQNGVPSGPQKHVIERYTLAEDGTRLAVEFTLEDPEYIVGSMTHRRELLYRPQTNMDPFNCDLESTRRFIPENN